MRKSGKSINLVLIDPVDYNSDNVSDLDLTHIDLSGADLSGADMTLILLSECGVI